MLDLDHFKMVNDQHGHPTGDFVLKEFAVIVRQSIRESDVASRTGGEEFAIILPRADRAQTDIFARRIRQTVAEHAFDTGSAKISITCSIGLACYGVGRRRDHAGPPDVLRRPGLYAAKGRAATASFTGLKWTAWSKPACARRFARYSASKSLRGQTLERAGLLRPFNWATYCQTGALLVAYS